MVDKRSCYLMIYVECYFVVSSSQISITVYFLSDTEFQNWTERIGWESVCVCVFADVSCDCPAGYVGNGDFCNGVLTSVLATNSNFSIFYKVGFNRRHIQNSASLPIVSRQNSVFLNLSVVFKLHLRHLDVFCIFNIKRKYCTWMYYWHDYSLYNWAQMKLVNLTNFTLSSTLCLRSCCWTIAAHPQRANGSSNFCRTGHQRSRCLSLITLASPKTRCCIASTPYSVLGRHSVECQ